MNTVTNPETGEVRDADTGRIVRGGSHNAGKKLPGAPSAYKPEYCDMIIEFFDKDSFTKKWVKSESTFGKGGKKTEYAIMGEDLPTFQGFARKIGVDSHTVQEWAKAKDEDGNLRYPDFGAAYKRAKDMQHEMLVTLGLSGLYNPIFAKFIAQNYTELRDKQAIDHTTLGRSMPAPMIYLPEDLPDGWWEDKDKQPGTSDTPPR